MIVRKYLIVILLLMLPIVASAQVDTDFWFAVPYLVNGHDNSQTDGAGKICVTALDDTAHITISQPAITQTSNSRYFAPITYTLPPHTSHDFDVMRGSISRAPQSGVGNQGIRIQSDHAVSAYYAQVNKNSEIYTLKGRNALGTSFYVAQQAQFSNTFSANPSIEIIASEDNTTVTITTPVTTYTSRNATTWTVTLNAGQTYTIRGMSSSTADHMGGTIITSDRPIAVNSTDDSLGAAGQDLVGEQLVPGELAGNEYIAIKHDSQHEYLLLYALPGRPITYTVNGGSSQTLAAGAVVRIDLSGRATYVAADDQFIAFQMTADGGELGATVLPRLECTGSYEVAYKKRFPSQILTLLVKTQYTSAFSVNGAASSFAFQPVAAAPQWSYCYVANAPFDANGIIRITNSQGIFHAAIMDYGGGTCSYGYFSGYNYVPLVASSDKPTYSVGDTIHLSIEDSALFSNVVWTFPDGSTHQGASVTNLAQSQQDAGTYTVTAESVDGCPVQLEYSMVLVDVEPSIPVQPECPVPDTIVESYTVCDTILGFGWHDMAFYQSGTYYDTLRTTLSDGYVCDSIYYVLNLTFVPCDRDPRLSAELLTTSLTLCDGDDALSLEFDLQEGSPHQCRLTIDSDTMLVDVPELWVGSNSLIIALTPDMAASLTPMADQVALGVALLDTLNALVTPTATCQITVLYDPEGVFAQKWDNVLAIYSPAYSPYGLTLTHDYQWYLNGQPIAGATGSYLHLDDATLQPTDFYQVEVTRLTDGVRRITCPYFPHLPSYAPAQSQLYDLMGRPLQSEPASGFYIRIEGDRQEKVMIIH